MGFNIGGGGGQRAYQSKNIPQYEDWASSGIANRAGVRKIENPEYAKWKSGQSKAAMPGYAPGGRFSSADEQAKWGSSISTGQGKAPEQYIYDTSQVGAPISREQAISPYQKDFDLLGKANSGFQNPTKFTQTYNPYSFNFESLPEEYAKNQYDLGAKDVRRESAGSLQRIKEAMGTRRPGLLMRAAESNERNLGEALAALNLGIRNKMLEQKSQLGKEQQIAQAGENLRGYQSRAENEGKNADEIYRYLQGMQSGAANKIGLESGIADKERAYQDQAINYLMQMYLGSADAMKSSKGSWNFGLNFGDRLKQ